MMKDDGCSRKTAATTNDINDDIKRGSVTKTNNDNDECHCQRTMTMQMITMKGSNGKDAM